MAKIEIPHDPQLTSGQLLDTFRQKFEGKYEVYPTKVIGADFVVKKSGMSGVFVKLKQKEEKTEIAFNRNAPSAMFRGLLGVIPMIFAGRDVMQDVKTYLETSQEIRSSVNNQQNFQS